MNNEYLQTVNWLYEKLPMFQRIGSSAFKKDLQNIKSLTEYLNHPEKKFASIHVAGTNGKGSTSHMIASVLQEAGYKVGLATSPHLKDFRERIRINGELCSEEFVIRFVNKHKEKLEEQKASFFEVATAMAFEYFSSEEVDFAVIETGLGGRLDSTNIINPILSVITNIGFDHTQFLGNTLSEIAKEKAGIIKNEIPVVIGETTAETKKVFEEIAKRNNSEIIFAEENHFPNYDSDLKGIYQTKNIRTVLTSILKLKELNLDLSDENIKNGLLNVAKNTGLRGRWDVLQEKPLTIADTAHNPHGLAEVSKQIKMTPHKNLHLVLGFVNDKDVKGILDFFPKTAFYYFSEPDVPRKLSVEDLKKIVPAELNSEFFPSVKLALKKAKEQADSEDLIYIGGSTFVVAEVI